MIYLDYAANTPVSDDVLDYFVKITKEYSANPNSTHKAGLEAKKVIDDSTDIVADIFKCSRGNVIYTSGSSESNNLVIKGIAGTKKGKKIIISSVEHSSIVAPCNYLASLGYDVSVIPLDNDGKVDLEILKSEINDDTILVSICAVDSELGTIQPIKEIGKIVSLYPDCVFHTDATQAIGKVDIDYTGVDFLTFAPHKFFGLNGFGCLINFNNIKLIPLIHGGKSTTIYRSGTPVTANVAALAKALGDAVSLLNKRYDYIVSLNSYLRSELEKIENVHINSPKDSIPNTINISLINKSAKEVVKKLQEKDIYLSTTTACAIGDQPSKSVMAITNDINLASNSMRISISHLTQKHELEIFIEELKKILI